MNDKMWGVYADVGIGPLIVMVSLLWARDVRNVTEFGFMLAGYALGMGMIIENWKRKEGRSSSCGCGLLSRSLLS